MLRVEKSFVNFALEKKSNKSNESLNVDLVKGHDVERQRRRDWYDRGVVYNYFHHEGSSPDFCSLVEPDKSKTKSWNAKSFTLGGAERLLNCQPRVRRGSKADLALDYRNSETCAEYESKNPGVHINNADIQLCICPCIKPETIRECACPECVEVDCERRALGDVIGCPRCKDGPWGRALASVSSLAAATSCPNEVLHGMRLPDSSEDFQMRPLRCCVSAPGEVPGVIPCPACSIELTLPSHDCPCFSEKQLSTNVVWLKRQPTIEGKNRDRVVERLRSFKGTVGELLRSFKGRVKWYLRHMWRARFTRRQLRLYCEYFDPATEAVALMDFASAMVLGSGYKSTCETDVTCNL